MREVLGLVMGGGRGAGLYPLTRWRSAPAVPVGGQYRLIDIPLSNCINSGLRRIYVLTQFLSVSLHRHISNTYKFAPFSRGFVEVLAAQQTNETADWYEGTADAIRQNLRHFAAEPATDVLILSGDGLYRMDYAQLVNAHRARQADITLTVAPVVRSQASKFGIARLAPDNRLLELVEKPKTQDELDSLRQFPSRPDMAGKEFFANCGIYVFRREVLLNLLESNPGAMDLVTEILTPAVETHMMHGHVFAGYWEDLGSIRTIHQANLALASPRPPFEFHNPEGIIYTRMRNLPASQIRAAHLQESLVSDGCLIQSGSRLERCVVGLRTHIGRDVVLRSTVVNGADRYENDAERAANQLQRVPDIGVGPRSHVENAILDKDCRIGADVTIINSTGLQTADGPNFVIRDGIVVIPKGAVVPDGSVI
jgi:glucose-1-phosphate adenylyltransferase